MKGVSLAPRGASAEWLMALLGVLLAGVVWSKPPVMVKQIRLWTGTVEAQLFIDLSAAATWKVEKPVIFLKHMTGPGNPRQAATDGDAKSLR